MKYLFPHLLLILSLFMHTANSEDMQHKIQDEEVYIGDEFYTQAIKPIRFTKSGMRSFMRGVFNNPEYCENILPYNFSHLIQFLQFGKDNKHDIMYMMSIVRLFNNKLKSTRYITAFAFFEMMEKFPNMIEPYCVLSQYDDADVFTYFRNAFNAFLLKMFTEQFNFFKKDPINFFEDISDSLIDIIEKEVERENFKQMVLRFLENAVGKIIWCSIDQENIWESTKNISEQFRVLYERNIIDEDELDDLYKSLLAQFCHFLELSGSDLSLNVIDKIKEDIVGGKVHLLELDEQEEFIESKKSQLTRALVVTHAKIIARQQGILSEAICVNPKGT